MCENKVEQIIPTRYSAKVLQMRCGSTSIYGEPLYCEACQKRGMRARPVTEYEDAGEDDFDPNWRFDPSN